MSDEKRHEHRKRQPLRHEDEDNFRYNFDGDPNTPQPTTADSYRIAGYVDRLVGASPECTVIAAHWDSGLKWADANNPKPDDWLWDGGVRAGVRWDGTFHRDVARYPAGGELFWSSYFKPGSAAGMKNGFWINFGKGWSHLHNDDPAQILAGASQKLFFDPATGNWTLVIEATKFVTHEIINVWTGTKAGGNDPTGTYTRVTGLDPVAMLTVEAG